jgi:hypothetical protein
MTDDLVERVAEEMWQAESMRAVGTRRTVPWSEAGEAAHMRWRPIAKAAIAIALEEAAQMAEAKAEEWATQWREDLKCDSHLEGKSDGADDVAAAIRAMIKEKNDE